MDEAANKHFERAKPEQKKKETKQKKQAWKTKGLAMKMRVER